jgi:ABC-type molybdate transport system ATPase subunit
VADLTGVNLMRGTAHGTTLDGGGRLSIAVQASGQMLAVITPAAVSVSRQRPAATGNVWSGQVGAVDLLGDRVRVRVEALPPITAEVMPSAVDELKLDHGGELWASVHPADVTVYSP